MVESATYIDSGWDRSAAAWIEDMGEHGDFARRFVLDRPMRARVRASGAQTALDMGCGEGRFSRAMAEDGIAVTGLDPTAALLDVAETKGGARFVRGRAEDLPFRDQSFDLVVAYLCLIDIEDLAGAYAEAVRVLRPGGRLLIANLSSVATAIPEDYCDAGWLRRDNQRYRFVCEDYHQKRGYWVRWRGIRVRNHHRPLAQYMQPLIGAGLTLTHFEEPVPHGGPKDVVARYTSAPVFVIMEWQKPV